MNIRLGFHPLLACDPEIVVGDVAVGSLIEWRRRWPLNIDETDSVGPIVIRVEMFRMTNFSHYSKINVSNIVK